MCQAFGGHDLTDVRASSGGRTRMMMIIVLLIEVVHNHTPHILPSEFAAQSNRPIVMAEVRRGESFLSCMATLSVVRQGLILILVLVISMDTDIQAPRTPMYITRNKAQQTDRCCSNDV